MGEKGILLKAVIQAIPVFAMSVFNIPKKLCKEMADAMAEFWWGDSENTKLMHCMAWWRMCIPKRDGGMGFCDLHSFNLAMLVRDMIGKSTREEGKQARDTRFNVENPSNTKGKKPRAPASQTSLYRGRFQTPGIYN